MWSVCDTMMSLFYRCSGFTWPADWLDRISPTSRLAQVRTKEECFSSYDHIYPGHTKFRPRASRVDTHGQQLQSAYSTVPANRMVSKYLNSLLNASSLHELCKYCSKKRFLKIVSFFIAKLWMLKTKLKIFSQIKQCSLTSSI